MLAETQEDIQENPSALFRRRCREAGLRVTKQRMVIYQVLASCKDHPDAEELYARVARIDPQLSLNTIYRTLGAMVSKGLVLRVASVGNAARFDACVEPHDHFYCRICHRVVDVPEANSFHPAITDGLLEIGDVEQTQILYVGVCRHCAHSEPC